MKRLSFLLVPFLLLAACQDLSEPLAPAAERALHGGSAGVVDVIIVLKPDLVAAPREVRQAGAAAVAQELGIDAGHTYGAALYGFSASVSAARLDQIRADPRVLSVELDRVVSIPPVIMEEGEQSDPVDVWATQVYPWGVNRTGALDQANATGEGVHVYVLDTGIDPDHPDLRDGVGEGHTVFTSTCRGNPKNCTPPTWHDDHGHGTHVAGTIGARDNDFGLVGIAPRVTLHAVKVLSENGNGSWSGIIAGVDWVADHNRDRPRVANMSLGGAGSRQGVCTPQGIEGSADALQTALCNATNTGVVFVVSAGNSGADASGHVPAAYYDAAITVSAAGCRNRVDGAIETCDVGSERFMDWSNWGVIDDPAWDSRGSLPVAIAAPGSTVFSTYPDNRYTRMSGTSMAAPHVAGAAARVLQGLGGSQPADGSAFLTVRAALLGATECTETWHNVRGNPHAEQFLNLRGPDPIVECVEPGDPPPQPPTELRAVGTTSSSVSLAWDHVAPDDARFEIWRYTGEWDHLAYVDGVTTYLDEGLSASTSYWYAVRTVTESYVSTWTNTVKATTLPDDEGDSPVAAFTYDCGNSDTCRFTNTSTGHFDSSSWNWDFGNGETATSFNPPPVTYDAATVYTVRLDVKDVFGRVDAAETEVTCRDRGNRLRCE
jgi:subtilisin